METHTISWRNISIEITFTPEAFGVADHIELRARPCVPLPVTETGYRSYFILVGTVAAHGGVVSFAMDWLEHEAKRTGWNGAQLSLF